MTQPHAGTEGPGGPERPARDGGRRLGAGTLRLATIVLAVLLVAAVVAAVVLGTKARAADERDRQRAAASAVASQFALRMDKVDGADFDGYLKGVNELLTTKAKTKNSQQLDVMKQSYQAAKVKGTGKVLMTAVGDSDEDSATVLVVHNAEVETTQGKLEHNYRWTVDLVKVKGAWLVDDFNPVN